jgi:hypothetical protein
MAITRQCDYCDQNEKDAGVIQHFVLHPTRRPINVKSLPLRVMDLCPACTDILTRPAGDEAIEVMAAKEEPKRDPIMLIDGDGNRHIPRRRNRPGRCRSRHPKSKTICIWDEGHSTSHQAANGQHWS